MTIPNVVTTKQMAEILGIHERTLQKLAQEGFVESKLGHDRWDMKLTIRHYAEHVRFSALSGNS
jgi:phage terminase Nu1 subunit (DNA packaging protein)